MNKQTARLNRRSFLASSAAASSMLFLPNLTVAQSKGSKSTGVAPSEKLNMAFIGIGGRGKRDLTGFMATEQVNMVALCDVDLGGEDTTKMRMTFPRPPAYQDYRELFDKEGDNFDAVCIATPDHSHFPITMHALAHGMHGSTGRIGIDLPGRAI